MDDGSGTNGPWCHGLRKFGEGTLKNIYIDGGTGSMLRTENLKRIVDTLFENFHVTDDYEFTLEGNARDYDVEKIDYVAKSRINRLSLGVQSFHPEILSVVGSPHAAQDSARVIRTFQAMGLKNIQIDLMYNMPGHSYLEERSEDVAGTRDSALHDLPLPYPPRNAAAQADK